MIKAIPLCTCTARPSCYVADQGGTDYEAKLKSELELRKRRALKFTVIRPGGLTLEPAGGVELGRTQVKKTR